MNQPGEKIDRTQYTELDLILWDTAARYIAPADALQKYEKRWRYVDEGKLLPCERALIDRLIRDFGNGVFLTA